MSDPKTIRTQIDESTAFVSTPGRSSGRGDVDRVTTDLVASLRDKRPLLEAAQLRDLIFEFSSDHTLARLTDSFARLVAFVRERKLMTEGLLVEVTGLDRLTVRAAEDHGAELLEERIQATRAADELTRHIEVTEGYE